MRITGHKLLSVEKLKRYEESRRAFICEVSKILGLSLLVITAFILSFIAPRNVSWIFNKYLMAFLMIVFFEYCLPRLDVFNYWNTYSSWNTLINILKNVRLPKKEELYYSDSWSNILNSGKFNRRIKNYLAFSLIVNGIKVTTLKSRAGFLIADHEHILKILIDKYLDSNEFNILLLTKKAHLPFQKEIDKYIYTLFNNYIFRPVFFKKKLWELQKEDKKLLLKIFQNNSILIDSFLELLEKLNEKNVKKDIYTINIATFLKRKNLLSDDMFCYVRANLCDDLDLFEKTLIFKPDDLLVD